MKKLLVLLGIGILLFYISPVFFKMIGIETLGLTGDCLISSLSTL